MAHRIQQGIGASLPLGYRAEKEYLKIHGRLDNAME
jgi:hypothetical protein